MAWPLGALADGPINCGDAQRFCECSALFEVLETADDDAAFEAMLRKKAQELRAQVHMWHGTAAGDKMVNSHINDLQSRSDDMQSTLDLAGRLAQCDGFITQSRAMPEVIVLP